METARLVLERGGAVCIFPEGTRHPLRARCAARGAASAASRSRPAPRCCPSRCTAPSRCAAAGASGRARSSCAIGRAMTFPRTEQPVARARGHGHRSRIWPNIELQWEWLGGLPPLRKAAVIGAGSWGTAVAVLLARGGLEVQLGCRTPRAGRGDRARGARTSATCPACGCPRASPSSAPPTSSWPACDLVCLAVPSAALPAAVGSLGDRIGPRSAVLLLTKGLVAPMGALPSDYVGERVRARAIACLGGPAHAARGGRRARRRWCSAAPTPTCAPSSARSSTAPGLVCERTERRRRRRDRRRRQERRRARRRGGRAARPQRRRDRRGGDLARVRRLRAGARRRARDLHRPRRRRRPDRDGARSRQPQPPRRRAARRGRPGRPDPRPDRPGLRGARLGAADRRDASPRAGHRRAGPRGPRGAGRGRHRHRGVGRAGCGAPSARGGAAWRAEDYA